MTYNAGDRLCNCTLIQKSGEGAYGEVWLAEDAIGARVALKFIKNGGRYSERELAGLKNYKDCNHPNLLKIRYVEISDKEIICIMDAADDLNKGHGEYLPDTLANRLRKYGRLDGKEITAMLDGLLAGLEELHKQGLVHRDIKPDNILWVNGRATLADVGLIAFEGQGSLVGTPGFLSPSVKDGNPAEAKDDFYALGKVIYCALTGQPANAYPSIPPEMTISVDANLNKAVRESCSRPVSSAAEFRQLLEGKAVPAKTVEPFATGTWQFPLNKFLFILFIVLLAGGFCYLFIQQQKIKEKHIVQPVPLDPEAEKKLAEAEKILAEGEEKLKQMKNADAKAGEELQNEVQTLFQQLGFFADGGKLLPVLLKYEPLTSAQMRELIWYSNRHPRLRVYAGVPPKTDKGGLSLIEQQILGILMRGYLTDLDAGDVKARQNYWRSQKGLPEQIQKEMLTSDPVMQAVALDAVIRSGINAVLRADKLTAGESKELEKLLKFRYYLLNPPIVYRGMKPFPE